MTTETATLGGGCFWCLEAAFLELAGVQEVKSGYAGGTVPNPSYAAVCEGTTGHAEVVRVTFDPAVLPYADLLRVFFTIHDPTTPNRQGNDVGTQYRSIILAESPAQAATAREVIAELGARQVYDDPIVTTVEALERFWPAETAHDRYYERNPLQPYCAFVVAPKVAKVRKEFRERLRKR